MLIINKQLIIVALLLLAGVTTAYAKTLYVSDQLEINMRSGKGTGYKITKIIKSGTPLTILKEESGYARARTPQGLEGWVLSRFLIDTPVARTQLAKAQQDVAEMKAKYDAMSSDLTTFKENNTHLSQSEQQLKNKTQLLNVELEKLRKIAARPMQLEAENDQLRNELVKTEAEMRLVKQEFQTLQDNSEQEWFLTGAGVLFGGMILGLIFPKLRSSKRKANWNRL